MFTSAHTRKPAPALARARVGVRLCVRPNISTDAFGQTLAGALVGNMQSGQGAGYGTPYDASHGDAFGTPTDWAQTGGAPTQGTGPWSAGNYENSFDMQDSMAGRAADHAWAMQQANAYDSGEFVPGGGTLDAELPGMGGASSAGRFGLPQGRLPSMYPAPQVVGSGQTSDGLAYEDWDTGARTTAVRQANIEGIPLELLATGGTGLRVGQQGIAEWQAQAMAVSLGGGFGLDPSLDPYVASGNAGFEGQIAGPLAKAIIDYKLGPRTMGAVSTVLGGYGVAAGVATLNPALVAVSMDQMYAGSKLTVTGDYSLTFVNQGFQAAGWTPTEAAYGEMALSLGAAAGPTLVNASSRALNGFGNVVSGGIESTLAPYTVAGRAMNAPATFEGTLYRAVGAGQDPLLVHSGNIGASHRYTERGLGGLYFATGEHIVAAEFVNNGASLAGKTIHSFENAKIPDLLDLTSPTMRNSLGVSLDDLTRTGGTQSWRYEVTQPLGTWAKQNGYRGIIAPSAQENGGVNLILFDGKGLK